MTARSLGPGARRLAVLALTALVVAGGVATVRLAAAWRADAAPLAVEPVSLGRLVAERDAELERSAALADQIDAVAAQLAELEGALLAANGVVDADEAAAGALRDRLAAAQERLDELQGQLAAAQERLAALNAAAARQSALNAVGGSSGGDPDETEEPERDDD